MLLKRAMQITLLFFGALVGIVSAAKFNSRHRTESSTHKNSPRTSKRNWIIQPARQAAKSYSASNVGAKILPSNGNIGSWKGNAFARYGQRFPQAAQLNLSQKGSGPVQMHQGSSSQQASLNDSIHQRTTKTTSVPKSSSFVRKVPNTSQAADHNTPKSVVGRRRNLLNKQLDSPLAAADVQGAVVEKGIEVMGQMVDKQLQIIDEAQQKAENFLKKEIKLDIVPDKGWQSEDMFVPPGYHLDSTITEGESSPKEAEMTPFAYPAGLGSVLMNGCYGTGYQEGDPCYVAKWTLDACLNMIDGAAFMGVGFDGRGQYSPDSRKMSIVQRSCAGKATYDDYDVPDSMNVHGIYDTKASMVTFESRSEFQKYLQEEAGVSGSYFGFYAGVKQAWGESSSGASQQYMALLSVDVNRYEVFLDEVKPEALSLSFLREFMSLPISYFAAGAPFKYQDFIQRWGTHYIKSSKFGGQLQIRKMMSASEVSSKEEFAAEMEMEYKSLFASVGAKASTKSGTYERNQSKTTSTTITAFGGSHEIASILSDAYSPTFKNEFKDWLVSIPKYPKPFQFQVGSITNLLNFRASDLFPSENINWGCEGNAANLQTETNANGDKVEYFESPGANGTMKKHYCVSSSRKGLEEAIKMRRISLQRAIEIYMEEGFISITDFKLPTCSSPAQDEPQDGRWQQITSGHEVVRVQFDMKTDLTGVDGYNIPRNMSRLVKYEKGKWLTSDKDGSFHLYNAFNNGNSDNPRQHKMSIMGLLLSYNELRETLELQQSDLQNSKQSFPDLHKSLVGKSLANIVTKAHGKPKTGFKRATLVNPPCNVKWSNTLRFDPTDSSGKCLHFTASTEGKLFVVFSSLPNDKSSWYYIEIGPDRVAIYKGQEMKTSTTDINARGLGDESLLQSYFVCVTESNSTTLVEYGKSLGSSDSGDIYLNMLDANRHLNVRFYAFGNSGAEADVIDAHIVSRDLTQAECKGETHLDLESRLCTQKCHEDCDPLHGCNTQTQGNPLPTECNVCRVAKDPGTGKCLPFCNDPKHLSKDGYCLESEATFDFAVKTFNMDGYSFKSSDIFILGIREIPQLNSITMSFWLRIPDDLPTVSESAAMSIHTLMSYGVSAEAFHLKWRPRNGNPQSTFMETWLEFETVEHSTLVKFGMTLEALTDHGWHHICITWSGDSGATAHYLDGTKRASSVGRIWSYSGGGYLYASSATNFPYEISGYNLWNKVLPPEEVKELSRSCVRGIGNIKTWMDFLAPAEKVKAKKGVAIRPSTCEAPGAREIAERK